MPKILIQSEQPGLNITAEIITISDIDGIYAIMCSAPMDLPLKHECPPDLEPGDTWSDLGDCVQNAIVHVANHESRQL